VIHHIATGDAIDKQMRYGLMPLTALRGNCCTMHVSRLRKKIKGINSKGWICEILRETIWRWIEFDGKTSQNGPCGINSYLYSDS
jgi:hypothetical protein